MGVSIIFGLRLIFLFYDTSAIEFLNLKKKYPPALQIIQMVIQNIFGTQNIMKSDGATLIHVKGYPDILTCLQTNSESTIVNFIIQLTTLPPIRIDVCPLIFNIFFDPKKV